VCAHAVRVALKGINGVETVDVSLNKGLATVTLKDGNTVTMKQMRDAIGKNGFSTKSSIIVVSGQILEKNGESVLRVSGSNEEFNLSSDGVAADKALIGKPVTVEGTVPEVVSGSSAAQLRARSIVERK
jgi:copper chaperone CopZ